MGSQTTAELGCGDALHAAGARVLYDQDLQLVFDLFEVCTVATLTTQFV